MSNKGERTRMAVTNNADFFDALNVMVLCELIRNL
jgi:hypothetical protein